MIERVENKKFNLKNFKGTLSGSIEKTTVTNGHKQRVSIMEFIAIENSLYPPPFGVILVFPKSRVLPCPRTHLPIRLPIKLFYIWYNIIYIKENNEQRCENNNLQTKL